jgi:uncharacterized protein
MFINQAIKPENKFWKYLLGSLIVFIAAQLGSVPLAIAVFFRSVKDKKPFPMTQDAMLTYLESNLSLFLLLLMFVFAIISLNLVVKYMHKQTFLSVTTSRKKVDWNRILFSFFLWTFISIAMVLVTYYMNPKDFVINFKPQQFAILALISIVMIPIQTSTEEYIFRGYLMQGFGNLARNKWFPLLMTSLIFGSLHFFNPEVDKMGNSMMIYYIGTGLFLGILTLMDDGMELSLGFHAANNLTGALLITSDWTVLKTYSIFKDVSNPEVGAEIFIPVFVIFPILMFIFSKKYGWSNWKEKLTGNIVSDESVELNKFIND